MQMPDHPEDSLYSSLFSLCDRSANEVARSFQLESCDDGDQLPYPHAQPLSSPSFQPVQEKVECTHSYQEDISSSLQQRLRYRMRRSEVTQKDLQKWDKRNGLPKSHSCTMVKTSRSRKQLLEGKIIPKWDGTPLIGEDGCRHVRHRKKSQKKNPSAQADTDIVSSDQEGKDKVG